MIFDERYSYRTQRTLSRSTPLLSGFHLDGPLLAGLLAISVLGLFVLYSAGGQNTELLVKQAVRLGVGLVGLVAIAQVPPTVLRKWTPWIYLAGIATLVLVLLTGETGKGAQRWLSIGLITFQPSELMKLAVPMAAAWYLHDRPLPPRALALIVVAVGVLLPVLLIARQPDLGTALLVAISGIFVVLLAGLRMRALLIAGAASLACVPVLWHVLQDYQRRRVLTFLNPETDPLGAGYHIIQSKIAIGSGGIFGKGWLNGSQAHLEFLPERSTDFIFAVLGEEFGLLGLLLMLGLYVFVVGRGLYIAINAQTTYARLLAGSITLTFFVYVFVNAGMVTGLLPVVGIPLPLVSYGGTSMVTIMAGFGILMSIQTHRRLLST